MHAFLVAVSATALAVLVPFVLSLYLGRPATKEVYGTLIYLWPAPFVVCAIGAILSGVGWAITNIFQDSQT